jgi:hypothetical protein
LITLSEIPANEMRSKIAQFIQNQYRTTKKVPTIRSINAKLHVRPKQFYAAFRGGLREACGAAKVPVPEKRVQTKRPIIVSDPNVSTQHDQSADPVIKVAEANAKAAEQETAKKEALLLLRKRKRTAERKGHQIDDEMRTIVGEDVARELLFDESKFNRAMRSYLNGNPALAEQLRGLALRLGSDFDTYLDQLLHDTFETVNHVAVGWPDICSKMGIRVDFPADANFVQDRWESILEDLISSLEANEYEKSEARLLSFHPDFLCGLDRTRVRHNGGQGFVCERGHSLAYLCPTCRSNLTFDGSRFYCPCCVRRYLHLDRFGL